MSVLKAAIDLGTNKFSCFLFEVDAKTLQPKIKGAAYRSSRGICNGLITDMLLATERLRETVSAAEEMAAARAKESYVSLPSLCIEFSSIDYRYNIGGKWLRRSHLLGVYRSLFAAQEGKGRRLLHIMESDYRVDGIGVSSPFGISGNFLDIKLHILWTDLSKINNFTRLFSSCGLRVERFIASSLASSLASLSADEKDLGVCLIDLGAGSSSFTIFEDGKLCCLSSIPVGIDHVTRDLARIFSLRLSDAERIKVLYNDLTGSGKNREIEVESLGENGEYNEIQINTEIINEVILARIEEIFSLLGDKINKLLGRSYNGLDIVLSGGGSQILGIIERASSYFGSRVRQTGRLRLASQPQVMSSSLFSVVSGLVLYASKDTSSEVNLSLIKKPYGSRFMYWFRQCWEQNF